MKTKKIKNQKPVSVDVSLKYRCPNTDCNNEHWLFLLEAQTKNFKIVCECGTVFKPKRIDNIKILYAKKIKTQDPDKIRESVISKAVPSLTSLGFSKEESLDLINKAYDKQPTDDLSFLIKNTLLELRNNG